MMTEFSFLGEVLTAYYIMAYYIVDLDMWSSYLPFNPVLCKNALVFCITQIEILIYLSHWKLKVKQNTVHCGIH